MEKRGQVAMEFLMTYGWAILIILIAVGALWMLGVFSPSTPANCSLEAPFSCDDVFISQHGISFLISSNVESATVSSVEVDGEPCHVALPLSSISKGSSKVVCNGLNLEEGEAISGKILLNYKKPGGFSHPVEGAFTGEVKKLTIGLVDVGVCTATVPNCFNWWKTELEDKGFKVEKLVPEDLDTFEEISEYSVILNTGGETYPEVSNDRTVSNNIRKFIHKGGFWFEAGAASFYYPSCRSSTCSSIGFGSPQGYVCLGMVFDVGSTTRNLAPQGQQILPTGMPSSISDLGMKRLSSNTYNPNNLPECNNDPQYFNLYTDTTAGSTYSGLAMHCYGKGCLVRTDVGTSNELEPVVDIYSELFHFGS